MDGQLTVCQRQPRRVTTKADTSDAPLLYLGFTVREQGRWEQVDQERHFPRRLSYSINPTSVTLLYAQ